MFEIESHVNSMNLNYSKSYIKEILKEVSTIAVVGASANKEKDSFKVMQSLVENDYKVFPVNPYEAGNLILGQRCYKDLKSIDEKIDMVDIFRAADAIIGITKQSIEIKAKVLWTQLGIINTEAADLAEKAGLKVVMNRCPKIELENAH